ncbi:MFS general substrate transporter [Meira miltonrushii]|uniref:MFS general substrate transporter n=1 Tax=Meira miltonrushii TaxID=1280837 RepID=A0A316VE83_9BASI|nr:MFS general substrate transporter [Meira miltonrushii]PWN33775.1 MFS general substrate transporter [Meira miltonrushii]
MSAPETLIRSASPVSTATQTRTQSIDIEHGKVQEDIEPHEKQSNSEKVINDPNEVTFQDAHDRENPANWSERKKATVLIITSLGSTVVTCSSSVMSSASESLQRQFHISREVTVLTISLFVIGIAVGPVLLGPLSEFYGRRPIYLISFAAFFLLQFPVAFANNLPVLLIFRFLVGAAGSAFLANVGGSISDMYSPIDAYIPMALFSSSTFLGPVLGPIIGGFVQEFSSRWQWMLYALIIWSFIQLLALFFFTPETLASVILAKRAKKLRKETGNQQLYTQHERKLASMTPLNALLQNVKRVFVLLALEPLLVLLCIWTAILLGIIYCFFVFFPVVYARHGFSEYQIGLAFLGLGVSNVIALLTTPFWKSRLVKHSKSRGTPPTPEDRLEPAMAGCLLAPIGLFIFAFTSYANVHWIASIIGSCIFGIGLILNFLAIFNYTATYWRPVAASALAANALIRCSFAAAFPLFGVQMADRLGTAGAAGLLAGLNVIMIPVPFALYQYGPWLRTKSRFVQA